VPKCGAVPIAIVTGSGGLIGSETVRHFVEVGFMVVGLEDGMRARFFGAPTAPTTRRLERDYRDDFDSFDMDVFLEQHLSRGDYGVAAMAGGPSPGRGRAGSPGGRIYEDVGTRRP
jgi:nucleoside-diphosphate-sugar epimerase